MSKIAVAGNASGTGTLTIAAPNTNSDQTITLPDATGSFVTADGSGNITIASGTANGVTYLNGSKVLTSGSALTFDGTRFAVANSSLTEFRIADTGGATDQKNWTWQYGTGIGAGLLRLRAGNDANTDGQNAYIIARTGVNVDSHQFLTGGSEQMRLTSTGLGIGTSSPTGKLDVGSVTGSVTSGDFIVTTASTTASVTVGRLSGTGSDNTMFNVRNRVGASVLYVNTGDGYVGIGTTTNRASAKLNVLGEKIALGDNPTYYGTIGYNAGSGLLSLTAESGGGINFLAGATERARIDTNGNVGIGTTSPNQKLVVEGNVRITNTNALLFGVTNLEASISYNGNGNLDIAPRGGYNTVFTTGNVGIGTSAPTQQVHVKGTDNKLLIESTNYAALQLKSGSVRTFNIQSINDGSGALRIYDETASAERMRVNSSGNFSFFAQGSAGSTTNVQTTDNHLYAVSFFNNSGLQWGEGNQLILSNSHYASGGEICKLTLNTSAGGYNNGATIHAEGAGAYNAGQLVFSTGWNTVGMATERMRINASGNLLVGSSAGGSGSLGKITTRSDSGTPLAVSNEAASGTLVAFMGNGSGNLGSISHNGASVAYNTTSDYRLKEDWVAVADASTRVNALKPVNFAWISSGDRVDGFLAHELAEVVPEAVTGTKDAVDAEGKPVYQGIDQSKLVPLLTAALQEALTRIESLEADVATLKGAA